MPVDIAEDETAIQNKRTANGFLKPPSLIVKLICELLGTLIFVFFGAGCAAKQPGLLPVSTAHGLVTIWLVYMFGPVSGGHFNAAATLAFAFAGKMKLLEIPGYLVAQAIGSLIAGAMLLWLYGSGSSLGTPSLAEGVTVFQAFGIEFLLGADRDGAALNPWRWLGPAVASSTYEYYAWIYCVGPVAGFLLGYGFAEIAIMNIRPRFYAENSQCVTH
ncbi:unnamed protein product, partial [Didymodactylos carnosus]